MIRRRLLHAALGVAVLAGCADQPTEPVTPSLSVSAAVPDRHVVAFKSKSIPADFAAAVAALGGNVDLTVDAVGGAVVSGLSAQGIAQLSSRKDVLGVEIEARIPMRVRASSPQVLDAAGIESVARPDLAILYSWQWNMRAVGANAAWSAGKLGSPNVKVAILDTGLDTKSPRCSGLDRRRELEIIRSGR